MAWKKPSTTSIKFQRTANILWSSLVAILALGFALFPVLWVLGAAFDPTGALSITSLIPRQPSLVNFISLLRDPAHPFLLWMVNSLKVSGITAILTVLIASFGAYAFSRFRFPGRRNLLYSLLLVQVFPNLLAMIALYIIVFQIGRYISALGLNTHAGLIMVYLGGALGGTIWLMKGFFDTIPKELDEAALIDGASRWQIFLHIIFPLVRPVLVVIGILTFISTYGDYILARILLTRTDNFTVAIGMSLFSNLQYNVEWGRFSAGSIMGALPIIILFYATQRWIVSGLTRGAVKG
jgi:arabinogalactan oligomer / maltooligosaccharide transport system permease protein